MVQITRELWQYAASDQGLAVAITPDGETIFAGAEDGMVSCLRADGGLRWQYKIEGEAFKLAITPDGQRVVVGAINANQFTVLDGSGNVLWMAQADMQTSGGVAISADGSVICGAADDGYVRMWDAAGNLLWQWRDQRQRLYGLHMTPDGEYIALGGGSEIYLLNRRGELLWKRHTANNAWCGARLSADGQLIAAGSNDYQIYLFNRAGDTLWQYRVSGNVNNLAITPDGEYIAVGSTDDHVYLLDRAGRLLWKYRTGESVYGLAISVDGQFVLAGSYDFHFYLLDGTGEQLLKQRGEDKFYSVTMTPDGHYFAAFGFDRRLYFHENLIARAGDHTSLNNMVAQRAVGRVRRTYAENPFLGLCTWFEEFNHYIRHNRIEVCEALLSEARTQPYPFTSHERNALESHEAALNLRRGLLAHQNGQLAEAETHYRRALDTQRKVGCKSGEGQARLALSLLEQERLLGERDPQIAASLAELAAGELHVLGASEMIISGRLADAVPAQAQQLIDVAKRLRLTRPLLQAMRSPDERTRMLAVATLNRFVDVGNTTMLIEASRDPNWFIRWQAIGALGRLDKLSDAASEAMLRHLLEILPGETEPETRRSILHALTNLGDRDLTPTIAALLNDRDPDVRYAAAGALAKFGDRRAVPLLQQVPDGDGLLEYNVREAAQNAINAINQRYPLPGVRKKMSVRLMDDAETPAMGAGLFWPGEKILLLLNMSDTPPETRITLRVAPARGDSVYEVQGSYSELLARGAQDLPALPEAITSQVGQQPMAFLLQADWPPAPYSAQILVFDESSQVDEQVSKIDFRVVDKPEIKDAMTHLTARRPGPFGPVAGQPLITEYTADVYTSVKLIHAPYGTQIVAALYHGSDEVERQEFINREEADHIIVASWRRERWPVGGYEVRWSVNGNMAGRRGFTVEAYTYENWHDLPENTPQYWQYLARHLSAIGNLDRLAATVKDLRYIARKCLVRSPQEAEADLYIAVQAMPAHQDIAILRRSFAQISHFIQSRYSLDEVLLTLYIWLRAVPGLQQMTAALLPYLKLPRFETALPLPGIHPAVVRTLAGHTESVWSCAFTPDGRYLVSVSDDMNIKVTDVETGAERYNLRGKDERQVSCAVSPDGRYLMTGGWPSLQIWDLKTGERRKLLSGHSNLVYGCKFSPDGTWAVSCSGDGSIRVWSMPEGIERLKLKHGSEAQDCVISPDGSWFATAGSDRTVRLWNAQTGALLAALEGHSSNVTGVAVNVDGTRLASCSLDGTIRVWDVRNGTTSSGPLLTMSGHRGPVWRVLFSRNGRWLISGGFDHTLRLWDLQTGQEHMGLRGHVSVVRGLALSPDERLLVSASEDKDVKIWDFEKLVGRAPIPERYIPMWFGALSPDGQMVVTDSYHDVVLWDANTGRAIRTLKGHNDEVLGCALSPDLRYVAACSRDKSLMIWDLETGSSRQLVGHADIVWRCEISPDGRWVVSASADRTLKIWDVQSGELRRTLTGHSGQINGCTVSPDGRWIVSCSSDESVRVWDAQTGELRHTLTGHGASVLASAFSPDSRWLASGGYDHKVKIWDVETGEEHATLTGHTHNIQGCAFSPDGRLLLTGASKGGLRVWDFESGECLTSMFIDRSVTNCAWFPDGQRIMVSSGSGLYFLRYLASAQGTR